MIDRLKIILTVTILVGILNACIEPFETNSKTDLRLIVIEGTVTDAPGETFVFLREAIPSGANSSVFRALVDAKASLLVNENERIELLEIEPGYFKPKDSFIPEVGNTYSLEFTTSDGNNYKSEPEEMLPVPEIKNIYQTTVAEGITIDGGATIPANYIYLDTEDPAGMGNFYLWNWKNYERQYTCKTCEGGRYFLNPAPLGACVEEAQLKRRGVIYDYNCDGACWEIFKSKEIIAQSDQFADGLQITGKLIAKIPYYDGKGGLIEIKQQSVSKEAYAYLSLLINQGQNTGGLADTPPAALVGNVKSLNQQEIVSGFFLVSSTATSRYWIDRTDMVERGFRPYGLLEGREIRPEPNPTAVTDRPPMAPCLLKDNRINIMPEGFR